MLISTAVAQPAGPATAPARNPFIELVPLILIFVIFYFLMIRPQMQARKKHLAMVNAVKKGDEVVTAGGIVGKVSKVTEGSNEIQVEIADKVQVKVLKQTLSEVRTSAPANDQ